MTKQLTSRRVGVKAARRIKGAERQQCLDEQHLPAGRVHEVRDWAFPYALRNFEARDPLGNFDLLRHDDLHCHISNALRVELGRFVTARFGPARKAAPTLSASTSRTQQSSDSLCRLINMQ